MSTGAPILVGCTNDAVWVKVEGKGSFLNSTGLKEFTREMLGRGHREFVIDLRNCPVMDSTFMGTLAGVALRLREIGQGHVRVTNLNERNSDLLSNLGLDRLFAMGDGDVTPGEQIPQTKLDGTETSGREQTARTMLDAHEALVKADAGNLTKFKDCLEYLREDLHRGE
ncbi:MAG: STAS domain-containing protein [Verrucomicrobiota bacterium]|nr:STAS domain-containing protein [Verrucomicrobiota bacterium]